MLKSTNIHINKTYTQLSFVEVDKEMRNVKLTNIGTLINKERIR